MTEQPAWLVDERWQKAYPIGETISIGRGSENDVILRDPAVSRLHATITRTDGGYLLRCVGASGTGLNGRAAPAGCVLREGDRVEIASSTLRFTGRAPDEDMIVLRRDEPVTLDRMAPATSVRLFAAQRIGPRWLAAARLAGVVLAFLAVSLLILLTWR